MNAQVDWVSASINQAKKRRDRGMKRAAEHADAVIDHWQETALEQLRLFVAQRSGAPFLCEDFRKWAQFKIPAPPDGRAFGAVIKRACKSGWIVSVGAAPANSSNRSLKVQWAGVPQ